MEDRQIIDLYWRRDEAAIEETQHKYGGLCRAVALRILRSAEDAEECVSDTWLSAWHAIPPRRPERLGAFLSRITRNGALMRLRKQSAAKRGGGELPLALEELGEIAGGASPETLVEQRELTETLDRFLSTLSAGDRILFLGRYWALAGVAELAERSGCSESKVKSSLWRSRKKLRQFLEKEGLL